MWRFGDSRSSSGRAANRRVNRLHRVGVCGPKQYYRSPDAKLFRKLHRPSVASASAAADGVTLPANMLIMITNSSNPTAYPITGFTWLLVYQNQKDQVKGQELVNLLWWILTRAQTNNNALTYPQLPASAITIAEAQVNSITFNGQPLHHN